MACTLQCCICGDVANAATLHSVMFTADVVSVGTGPTPQAKEALQKPLGIDFGKVRIGVAIGQLGWLASPCQTVETNRRPWPQLAAQVLDIAQEQGKSCCRLCNMSHSSGMKQAFQHRACIHQTCPSFQARYDSQLHDPSLLCLSTNSPTQAKQVYDVVCLRLSLCAKERCSNAGSDGIVVGMPVTSTGSILKPNTDSVQVNCWPAHVHSISMTVSTHVVFLPCC